MSAMRHPYPQFRVEDKSKLISFARERGFGVLTSIHEERICIAHAPFILDADGGRLWFHLHRANPIIKAFEIGAETLLVVNGPDGYISLDWYEIDHNSVPTWNYSAVHMRGVVSAMPQDKIGEVLTKLSTGFEERIANKPPWKMDKMDEDYRERMLRAIIPLEMVIQSFDGIWKYGSDKPVSAIIGAAAGVRATGIGLATYALASLMEKVANKKEGIVGS